MELPAIVEKMYVLCRWLMQKVSTFPKDQRFILGHRIEAKSLDILDNLIEAALLPKGSEKEALLRRINLQLEQLRFLIRMAKDGKYLSLRAYEHGMAHLLEIGKMLGGWIKTV